MIFDLIIIFSWWILLLSLGAVFLPLSFKIFSKFQDGGYAFSKIIALAVISYIVWLLGDLRIFSFTAITVWVVIFLAAGANLFLIKEQAKAFAESLKKNYKVIIFEELIFILALFAWALVRAYEPRIEGAEKFMDFGFVNAILRSEYFPPQDIWLSGEPINYYYFGHMILAVLTKISGIPSAITYNLMIATIFASTFTAVFSLISNMVFFYQDKNENGRIESNEIKRFGSLGKVYPFIGGLVSAFVLVTGGNLQTMHYYITNNYSFNGYWYPVAIRFIPNTIHEIPIYSFILSDLHAIFSAIPFVVLIIALVFAAFINGFGIESAKKYRWPILFGFFLAILYMINTSDWIIYGAFLGLAVSVSSYRRLGMSLEALRSMLIFLIVAIGTSLVFIYPFYRDFKLFVKGMGFVHSNSTPVELSVLWGFYLFLAVSFAIILLWEKGIISFGKTKKKTLFLDQKNYTDIFVSTSIIFAFGLILVPEIIYMKDIYGADFYRGNTMLKFAYEAWIVLALVSGYIVFRCLSFVRKKLLIVWVPLFVVLFYFVMSYPYFAINYYYGNFKEYKGLMGTDWLHKAYSDDYNGIKWLNDNAFRDSVLVEAVDGDYSYYGRVSVHTGLPAVVNWPVHEWLWRGSYDEPGKRQSQVQQIYESNDLEKVKSLIEEYRVTYVFVGALERTKYPGLNEEKFKKIGSVVFNSGTTTIYKMNGR